MLDICEKLFSEWNEKKICYCHWKSNEHLCEGLDGITDLDILLNDNDRKYGCNIMKSLDFLNCRSQYGSRYPDVEDWIGFDRSTGKLIHIHLHYKIVTGHKGMKEYTLPWYEDVLKTRIKDEKTDVYISCPELELITLYTRIGLKATAKQKITAQKGACCLEEGYTREIDYLKKRISWDILVRYLHKYYGEASKDFLHIIKSDKL